MNAPSWYYSEEVMEKSARNLCMLRNLDPEDMVPKPGAVVGILNMKRWKYVLQYEIIPHCDIELAVAKARYDYSSKINRLAADDEWNEAWIKVPAHLQSTSS